jgi:hypothetical protein
MSRVARTIARAVLLMVTVAVPVRAVDRWDDRPFWVT